MGGQQKIRSYQKLLSFSKQQKDAMSSWLGVCGWKKWDGQLLDMFFQRSTFKSGDYLKTITFYCKINVLIEKIQIKLDFKSRFVSNHVPKQMIRTRFKVN